MRIALGVEYDGSRFRGWQRQEPGVRTVQGSLEAALARVADHPVKLACAGRTDAGVHASAQVAHFDTGVRRLPKAWVLGCNTHLPADVSVTWACPVPDAFHARFSATGRRYRYVIHCHRSRPALGRGRMTWCRRFLDAGRMDRAGQVLVGRHDFTSFRALGCQARSPVREVRSLAVWRRGDLVILEVAADAFLHHMVRNIAGVLMAIGSGEQPAAWVRELLALRDRSVGGVTARPDGLYLIGVSYGSGWSLPAPPRPPL